MTDPQIIIKKKKNPRFDAIIKKGQHINYAIIKYEETFYGRHTNTICSENK